MTPTIESKLPQVGTTIFTVMSRLAAEHNAINLSQGYPDFDCAKELRDLLKAGENPRLRALVFNLLGDFHRKNNRLEDAFWFEEEDGKWQPRQEPTESMNELIRERTSTAVKDALGAIT